MTAYFQETSTNPALRGARVCKEETTARICKAATARICEAA